MFENIDAMDDKWATEPDGRQANEAITDAAEKKSHKQNSKYMLREAGWKCQWNEDVGLFFRFIAGCSHSFILPLLSGPSSLLMVPLSP